MTAKTYTSRHLSSCDYRSRPGVFGMLTNKQTSRKTYYPGAHWKKTHLGNYLQLLPFTARFKRGRLAKLIKTARHTATKSTRGVVDIIRPPWRSSLKAIRDTSSASYAKLPHPAGLRERKLH